MAQIHVLDETRVQWGVPARGGGGEKSGLRRPFLPFTPKLFLDYVIMDTKAAVLGNTLIGILFTHPSLFLMTLNCYPIAIQV